MRSLVTKYMFIQFIKQHKLVAGIALSVALVSVLLWGVALIQLIINGSNSTFDAIHYSYVSQFTTPMNLVSLLEKPWSIITSFFIYSSFFQLILDVLLLFAISALFLRFFSKKHYWECLVISQIFGFIFYVIPTSIFPLLDSSSLLNLDLGVSAIAYGLFFAVVAAKPKFSIPFFKYQISMQTIGLIFLVINILTINKLNFLLNFSHFGGVLAGFSYGFARRKKWFPLWKRKKMSFGYGNAPKRPVSDDEYNANRVKNEQKINSILDKISKTGYNHLTDEEKEFLFKYKRK